MDAKKKGIYKGYFTLCVVTRDMLHESTVWARARSDFSLMTEGGAMFQYVPCTNRFKKKEGSY